MGLITIVGSAWSSERLSTPLFVATLNNFSTMANFTARVIGEPNTLEYRMFFEKDGKQVSLMHDVPLVANSQAGTYNMIVEIPKGTNAKLEIAVGEEYNPIKQDTKNGKLRYVANLEPHTGYPWNYGAFPQTWEDPNHKDANTQCLGDKDPLDVCEVGEAVANSGDIKEVKVIGTLALIDEGETDWKIIAIDVKDPNAGKINDIEDLEAVKPGYLKMMHDWFRDYKIPDGKPPNTFAFEGQAKNKAFAEKVVAENHEFWKKLIDGTTPASSDSYKVATIRAGL